MSIEKCGAAWRHHREGAPTSDIPPSIVGKSHPGAVVQHAGVVVEVESKETQLGPVTTAKRQFAVGIGEPKRQTAIVDVWVKKLRALLEVAVLDAQEITDPAGAVLGHGTERTVDQQLRAKGTGPHFSFCLAHVPIARPDVHDRTDAASVFGRECACVNIRIGQGVGIKDAEQANAVKCVVDEHAV